MNLKITEYKSKYETLLPQFKIYKKNNDDLNEEKNKLKEEINLMKIYSIKLHQITII